MSNVSIVLKPPLRNRMMSDTSFFAGLGARASAAKSWLRETCVPKTPAAPIRGVSRRGSIAKSSYGS